MAAVEENGQTERVSADLLATSVSKAVLAKEVLRLKQLRDELLDTTADSVPALEERCKLLRRDILDEEERGARETAELADHLARVRENLLAQREAAEARESGQATCTAGRGSRRPPPRRRDTTPSMATSGRGSGRDSMPPSCRRFLM